MGGCQIQAYKGLKGFGVQLRSLRVQSLGDSGLGDLGLWFFGFRDSKG